jgi:hypothetical protein
MTKPAETKERFIELRASGMTLAKSAQELGIAYNTALNWQRELVDYIRAAKAFKMEELMDKYQMTKEKRIELYGERLLAIQEELSKRDFKDIPTPKLFEMMIRLSKALEAESIVPNFLTEDDIKNNKKERENNKKDREIDLKQIETARNEREIFANMGL